MKLKNFIGNKAYIYGTGNFALRIMNVLDEEKIDVNAFLEISKEIYTFDNLPVYKLNQFENLDKTIPVIIGLGNPQADIKFITTQLETSGFQIINPIQFAIYAFNSGHTFENYWLTGDLSIYHKHKNEIALARSLLKDEKSKQIFDEVMEYRKTGKIETLPEKLDVSVQYIAPDLPWNDTFDRGLNVLDGGAFDGDTYENFKKAGIKVNSWVFVEPDVNNFSTLLSKYSHLNENFSFLNIALSSKNTKLHFQSSSNVDNGSKLSSFGNAIISVLNIDSIEFRTNPNFIKLDIEGEELNALLGGSQTISLEKPIIAVSVYHTPLHHWQIINYIDSILPRSSYYLRIHGNQTFDSILYVFPNIEN